jgi:hypothetical protein
MVFLHLGVTTNIKWIDDVAKTPILGGVLLFVLMFIPPVLFSFLAQLIFVGLNNDIGFTKAMLVLLPTWNLFLWLKKIRLTFFHIPAWVLFGAIAIIKGIRLIAGFDDGQ